LEEGKGKGYLTSSRQYGNALLGVRHQEEEEECRCRMFVCLYVYDAVRCGAQGQCRGLKVVPLYGSVPTNNFLY